MSHLKINSDSNFTMMMYKMSSMGQTWEENF